MINQGEVSQGQVTMMFGIFFVVLVVIFCVLFFILVVARAPKDTREIMRERGYTPIPGPMKIPKDRVRVHDAFYRIKKGKLVLRNKEISQITEIKGLGKLKDLTHLDLSQFKVPS